MTLREEFRSCWLIATIGCFLFVAGISILFWNEGRAAHMIVSLDEALDSAITINAGDEVENNYEGRIVHIAGPIVVGEPLTEPDYDIQILAVKLKRRVQMYQWVEETMEQNYGDSLASVQADSKTYYYSTQWRDKLIDSRSFYIQTGHHNPKKFPVESQTQVADSVFLGRYELGSEIKAKFDKFVELTSDTRPEDPSIKLHLGLYYHSDDVFNPQVGDFRLLFSFSGMEGELYTIVGQLHNGKVVPYVTSRNAKILLVYPGEISLAQVFKMEHHAQRLTTWGFRFVGWVCLFFGATCTASLLHIILSRVYYLSSLAPDPRYPAGTNLMLSLSLALVITSVAWALHRPWVGAGLLLAAASPFLYCARTVTQYQDMN